jgi:hypothetical protein
VIEEGGAHALCMLYLRLMTAVCMCAYERFVQCLLSCKIYGVRALSVKCMVCVCVRTLSLCKVYGVCVLMYILCFVRIIDRCAARATRESMR